jgi:hypothetical protein
LNKKKKSFAMIASSFVLGLTCIFGTPFSYKEVEASTTFLDVKSNYWAKKEIDYLTNLGIIKGYSNGKFGINDSVKRAQVAIMLVRALKLNTNNRPNPEFSDIPTNHYAYKEIATVVDEGLFSKAEKFNPEGTLTRGQMSKIFSEAFNLP